MNLDVLATVAKRHYHLNFARALELSFERHGLATMVVLGCITDVDLSCLKDGPLNIRKQVLLVHLQKMRKFRIYY